MLDYPYVSVAEFRRHPTFLDSNNLVTAGTQAAQDAALFNALLTASQWADDQVNMPLGAHVRVENVRLSADRSGRLRYHPEHAPVLAVTGLAFGATPDGLATVTDPQVWTEQDGRCLVAFSPGGGTGLDSLQFGLSVGPGEQLVRWTYVAGYPSTQLVAPAEAAATTLTVRDPVGIQVGDVLRLWTPGLEEAVTVSALAGDELTLAGALANAHPAEATLSALPTTVRQAVINCAIASLQRSAPVGEQMARGPAMSSTSGDKVRTTAGTHLLAEARRLLQVFERIR